MGTPRRGVLEVMRGGIGTPATPVEFRPKRNGKQVLEITTTGIDENLQLIARNGVGLRVPTLATSASNLRYLFMLAAFSVGEGTRGRIVGYRQLVTIAEATRGNPGAIIEMEVTSPFWHFQDANISWHLQTLGPNQGVPFKPDQGPSDTDSFRLGFSMNPALLYQTATLAANDPFYVDLTAYTPPNNGRPWGRPLRNGGQGTFLDLRSKWRSDDAWGSLDIPFEGPDVIALFASVAQTNPSTRATFTPPGTFYQTGISPEDAFVLNFPSAIYHRIAGSLIVEAE
jgi:hypothetical protein